MFKRTALALAIIVAFAAPVFAGGACPPGGTGSATNQTLNERTIRLLRMFPNNRVDILAEASAPATANAPTWNNPHDASERREYTTRFRENQARRQREAINRGRVFDSPDPISAVGNAMNSFRN